MCCERNDFDSVCVRGREVRYVPRTRAIFPSIRSWLTRFALHSYLGLIALGSL